MADILENPVDLIDDAYEQEIQVEQEMIEVVAYRSYNQLDDKPQINGVELVGNKTSSDLGITAQIESAINSEAQARAQADNTLQGKIDTEIHDRQVADIGLQGQIDAITSKSDVVDVVANYAALQAYDTSTLGNNDVVKVLDDETHEDALTYYRWSTTTQTWSYIGQEAPYYSKGQMDVKLAEKQDKLTAGANIQIQNGTISATDTTYTAGNGLNLNGTEFSADTDVLATKEDLEGYYTKTEADNLLAPKLEAEVVAELPATGTEGKLYLTPKAHTTSTATGNPIEATVTEQAGQLESFQLDGDTFQQTYTGKNLLPLNGSSDAGIRGIVNADGSLTIKGTAEASRGLRVFTTTRHFPAGTYTLSISSALSSVLNLTLASNVGFRIPAGETSITTTLEQNYGGGSVFFAATSGQEYDITIKAQLVSGSTPDYDFEPYVGEMPSPSPDYPQQIQTVTGEQTVSINGTNYPISLGSIELCKLGTYQDYIWKDGNDWKVHKETKRISVDGSQRRGDLTQYGFAQIRIDLEALYVSAPPVSYCSNLPSHDIYDSLPKTYAIRSSSTQCNFRLYFTPQLENFNAYLDWCAENKPSVVAPLQQSAHTDTTITDTALIAQLEAVRTAALENGANTISNAATGTNLAGDMEIGYYGFNPTNRYDKWLWLDLNNNYEKLGS